MDERLRDTMNLSLAGDHLVVRGGPRAEGLAKPAEPASNAAAANGMRSTGKACIRGM
jgi:hypothetical protein